MSQPLKAAMACVASARTRRSGSPRLFQLSSIAPVVLSLSGDGDRVGVLGRGNDAFINWGALAIGEHDGFDEVPGILLRADMAEIGLDVASLSIDAVATEALNIGMPDKDFFPCFDITS